MRIYVDVRGTIIGNAAHPDSACLQAVYDMDRARHHVELCSGDPGGVGCILGRATPIADKGDLIAGGEAAIAGCALVDDDAQIRAVWTRLGGIAVPAVLLVEFAEALVRR